MLLFELLKTCSEEDVMVHLHDKEENMLDTYWLSEWRTHPELKSEYNLYRVVSWYHYPLDITIEEINE